MSNELRERKWSTWVTFSKTANPYEIDWTIIEKSRPENDPNVYAICCRLEEGGDVISGRIIKSIQGYVLVNFKGASFSTFRDFPKRSFCDGEIGDGSMNVICSRPEEAYDVIAGKDVDKFR